jgi:hypothetical protein
MGFLKSIGFGGDTQKDFFSVKGQTSIVLGNPGYLYDESKDRKKGRAQALANDQEAAIVQTKMDAQDAANRSIIDARRRKRASSLVTSGTPLGGVQTALGAAGGATGQPLGSTALGYGGY